MAEGSIDSAWGKVAPCKPREGLPSSHPESGLVSSAMKPNCTWSLDALGGRSRWSWLFCFYVFFKKIYLLVGVVAGLPWVQRKAALE